MNFINFFKKKNDFTKMFGLTKKNLKKRKEYFEKTDYLHVLMPEEDVKEVALQIIAPHHKRSEKISTEEFISRMCERFLVTPKQMLERLKFLKIID